MPAMPKTKVIFVRTRQKHLASIPGTADWTWEIKVLVK